MAASLLAGVGEHVITPPVGTPLFEPPDTPATGVHDDLFVRALALSDGQTIACIVTLDLLGLDADLVEHIHQAVQARTGLPPAQLMLAASHNHSAPLTLAAKPASQPTRNRAWEAHLIDQIAGCVAQAQEQMVAVTLAAGRAPVQIGVNRRLALLSTTRMMPNPAGPLAPWVDVIRVDRVDGRPLAVLFSHAAHPVTVHDTATEFSADYPGAAVQTVRRRLGEEAVALFAQGCAGNVNVLTWRGGFAAADQTGQALADAVANAARQAVPAAAGPLRIISRELHLPYEQIPADIAAALLQRVQESYDSLQQQGGEPRALADQQSNLAWARRMLELAQQPDPAPGLPFQVQGIALGDDLAILGLSSEPFVEYQLFLQEHSPFPQTLVLGYTNCYAGYIPTAADYYLGGYEAHGAHKFFRAPRLSPAAEGIVKESCLSVLRELRQ
jgi:neutral ceramidase